MKLSVIVSARIRYAGNICLITPRAKLSGAVYCYQFCLCATGRRRVCVFVCLWVCYHDNLKLRASIFTKLGLRVKVVTISSWLNFGRSAPPGRGSAARRTFLAPPYYSQRAVFVSLRALFR